LVLFLTALTAAGADEPAWQIEITTSGGFTGHGAGDLTTSADGRLVLRPGCALRLTEKDLRDVGTLVEKAKPREWKASYVRPTNPNGCCDMIRMTLTLTRGGTRWTSTWFDDHLPLPADLEAIVSMLWTAQPANLRSRYRQQCK
jgi:hypothetical protein